jgi:hypothetical protein
MRRMQRDAVRISGVAQSGQVSKRAKYSKLPIESHLPQPAGLIHAERQR